MSLRAAARSPDALLLSLQVPHVSESHRLVLSAATCAEKYPAMILETKKADNPMPRSVIAVLYPFSFLQLYNSNLNANSLAPRVSSSISFAPCGFDAFPFPWPFDVFPCGSAGVEVKLFVGPPLPCCEGKSGCSSSTFLFPFWSSPLSPTQIQRPRIVNNYNTISMTKVPVSVKKTARAVFRNVAHQLVTVI